MLSVFFSDIADLDTTASTIASFQLGELSLEVRFNNIIP